MPIMPLSMFLTLLYLIVAAIVFKPVFIAESKKATPEDFKHERALTFFLAAVMISLFWPIAGTIALIRHKN